MYICEVKVTEILRNKKFPSFEFPLAVKYLPSKSDFKCDHCGTRCNSLIKMKLKLSKLMKSNDCLVLHTFCELVKIFYNLQKEWALSASPFQLSGFKWGILVRLTQ